VRGYTPLFIRKDNEHGICVALRHPNPPYLPIRKGRAPVTPLKGCDIYDGYVFVDAMGNIFNPRSVTANFSKLLEQNGLRHIRFHDLRHSCASLLLANDVPLKQIQEWLGHSDIGTTANIYSHLDYKSKITSANVMDNILTLPDTRQTGWHT